MAADVRYRDADWLRRKYEGEGMTGEEIGGLCGVTDKCIYKWLHRHGIETRRATDRTNTPATFYTDYRGYEIAKSYHDGKYPAIGIHRLVAVAEFGIDAVKGRDVHHKNGIKWDNRPENLEPVGTPAHERKLTEQEKADKAFQLLSETNVDDSVLAAVNEARAAV